MRHGTNEMRDFKIKTRSPAITAPVWSAVAILLAGLAGCITDDDLKIGLPADTPITPVVSEKAEDVDHRKLVKAFGGEYDNARIRSYLERLVARIVPATERPSERYRVTILNSPVVNAFALPNGRLYVTRGLLALASDDAEIAAVMAHEIAHVTLRHAAARTELELRSALVTKVVADVLLDADGSSQQQDRSRFTIASFSRSQELDADKIGVKTLSASGIDPYGATRFLKSLERSGSGSRGGTSMLSTHPSTKERIDLSQRAARQLGAPGIATNDRDGYLAAINGLVYGEDPKGGIVRGRKFIHGDMHIAFEAPPGFQLENSSKAVLGTGPSSETQFVFDVVERGTSPVEALRRTWSDGSIVPGDFRTETVNGLTIVTATASHEEWSMRLAAIDNGDAVFRLIVAGKGSGAELGRSFQSILGSMRRISDQEAANVPPLHIRIVRAAPGDSTQSMAGRMATDRGYERFLLLNGLDINQKLQPGESYKIVTE